MERWWLTALADLLENLSGLDSQHLHGSLQPCITTVPGDLSPFPALHRPRHAGATQTYKQAKQPYACDK